MFRVLDRVVAVIALIAGFAGIGTFLLYWDHTRIDFKRWSADDVYQYDRIDPRLAKIDPLSIMQIRSEPEIGRHRALLAAAIWERHGLPFREQPIRIIKDFDRKMGECPDPDKEPVLRRSLACALPLYRGIENLAGIDQVFVAVHEGHSPSFAHFRPKEGNGRLVIYHHGFAGTYHDQHRHIERLIGRGYAVMAFNLVGYGDTTVVQGEGKSWKGSVENPQAHFEPVVVAINYALESFRYKTIDMIGLSAGGWATAVMAALDPRIRRSYPVAGV
ncbi:MAG: alpha/beta hydrolase, partial [Rhodospirillales bacterium]|nr:alpha/beta hydrolase [Rhodospirillales bacterium]